MDISFDFCPGCKLFLKYGNLSIRILIVVILTATVLCGMIRSFSSTIEISDRYSRASSSKSVHTVLYKTIFLLFPTTLSFGLDTVSGGGTTKNDTGGFSFSLFLII